MLPQPRFQSLDTSDFSDGNIPVYNADTGKFTPAGGTDPDGVTLRIAQILTDAGAPSNATGLNGDFYLDKTSANYYSKVAGTWTLKGNLKGTPGGIGDKGPVGDKGPTGDPGLSGIPSNDANIVHKNDFVSPLNTWNGAPLYNSDLNDFFFQADKRFGVTINGNTDVYGTLFDGDYGNYLPVPSSSSCVVTLDIFSKNEYTPNGVGITFIEGYLFVSFFYNHTPQSVTARWADVYGNWHDCPSATVISATVQGAATQLWKIPLGGGYYGRKFEITVTASSSGPTSISEIECFLTRPQATEKFSGFSKNSPQKLYHRTTWNKSDNTPKVEISSEQGIVLDGMQLNPGNLVRKDDYISPNNAFGGVRLYNSKLDNFFFQADKRFGCTWNGALMGDGLFNGNYEGIGYGLAPSQSGVALIDLTAKGEYVIVPGYSQGVTYSEGFVFVSFYNISTPASVSMRMRKWDGVWIDCAPGIAFHSASGVEVWRITHWGGNWITAFEITITAKDDAPCSITEIECQLLRPGPTEQFSGLDRNFPQKLYQKTGWNDANNDERASIEPTTGTYKTRGDVICDDPTRGSIYKSPNGHYWRITRDNDGNEVKTDLGTVAPS